MADEIQITCAVVVEKGSMKYSFQPDALSIDQTSIGRGGHTQSVGTTEELLDIGDLLVEGWVVLHNLDTTNYITWGPQDPGSVGAMIAVGKLKAGEFAIFRMDPSITLMAKANTAACQLDVTVLED